ncbi:MAG: DUF4198 domain-containing protein [Armatimonadota bacterium]|nr:DUF4198 domain-containing protein [Chloroflexota bacterium]MEA3403945.1 DUF4198 domain-containing protein [Armatimonadota bacterium]
MVNRRILGTILVLAAICTGLAPAVAHDWFIQATDYALPEPGRIALFMGWGHALPLDDPLDGAKIATLHMTGPDGAAREIAVAPGRGYHYTPLTLDSYGVWTLHGTSNPGYYTIYQGTDGKQHHSTKPLNELDDVARVFMSVRAFQFPKSYVLVGDPETAEMPHPVGAKLEIVPESVPGTIHAGQRLSFQVLFDGKPLEAEATFDATYLGFSTAPEDYMYMERPIVNGRGWIDLSHEGPWFIRVHHTLPAPEDMEDEFRNLYYDATLVLHVHPRESEQFDHAHAHQ